MDNLLEHLGDVVDVLLMLPNASIVTMNIKQPASVADTKDVTILILEVAITDIRSAGTAVLLCYIVTSL